MACMCGDTYCPSCGPAQGNSQCPWCGCWEADGGCQRPDFCAQCERQAIAQEIERVAVTKPLTAVMIETLRTIEANGSVTEFQVDRRSLNALWRRKLAAFDRKHRWTLTPAGRRVLAEQEQP